MNVPLLDLKAQYRAIKSDVDAAVAEVMDSQHFILGPKVEQCEKAIARYSHCSHAVGVSSGTDALLACLMAENIGPGDEVITTPYTFFATAGAIARVGATPVFVDIDPVTYNLDPSLLQSKVTTKTRAIIPVHLYGQMANLDAVMSVAERHGLVVIEDAAQAVGAEHKGGRAGSTAVFRSFPQRILVPRGTVEWSSRMMRSVPRSSCAFARMAPNLNTITSSSEGTFGSTLFRRQLSLRSSRTWMNGRPRGSVTPNAILTCSPPPDWTSLIVLSSTLAVASQLWQASVDLRTDHPTLSFRES